MKRIIVLSVSVILITSCDDDESGVKVMDRAGASSPVNSVSIDPPAPAPVEPTPSGNYDAQLALCMAELNTRVEDVKTEADIVAEQFHARSVQQRVLDDTIK